MCDSEVKLDFAADVGWLELLNSGCMQLILIKWIFGCKDIVTRQENSVLWGGAGDRPKWNRYSQLTKRLVMNVIKPLEPTIQFLAENMELSV